MSIVSTLRNKAGNIIIKAQCLTQVAKDDNLSGKTVSYLMKHDVIYEFFKKPTIFALPSGS
jgi:predicted transcriptional regulator